MGTLRRFSLPTVILLFILIILLSVLDVKARFEPNLLYPILNSFFIVPLTIVVICIAGKVYIQTNKMNGLFLSCGMLALGLGSILAGWLRFIPNGANVAVTIFDACAFVAAVFHLLSSTWEVSHHKIPFSVKRRKSQLILFNIGICSFVGLLVLAIYLNLIPPFVNQNGFTMLRQGVMWSAIAFYFSASMVLVKIYNRQKTNQMYWYAMSLIMMVVGLFAACVSPAVGGIIVWLGRIAQYLGGLYVCFSVLAAKQDAIRRSTDFASVIADFFFDAEESYKSLVETSNDAIITIDHNSIIFFANPAASILFGYELSELKGVSIINLLVSEPKYNLLQDAFKAFAYFGKSPLKGDLTEIEARKKNGDRFPAEISFSIRQLPTDSICTVLFRDITDRKRMEQELRKEKERIGEAQKISQIGIAEWNAAEDELFWSDEVYNLYGLDKKTTKATLDLGYIGIDGQDKVRVAAAFVNAMQGKTTYDETYWITTPDGKRKCVRHRGYARTDTQGLLSSMLGTLQDITEQKLSEMEIMRVKENLEEAQSIAHIGSWEWGIQNNTLVFSDEVYKIMELDPNTIELYKTILINYLDEEGRRKVEEDADAAVYSKAPYNVEYTLQTPSGRVVHIQAQGKVKYDADGKPFSMAGTIQDITERKLAEQETKRHAEFEHTILSLAQDFINIPLDEIDATIAKVLQVATEYCQSDCAIIYRYNFEEEVAIRQFGWDKKLQSDIGNKAELVSLSDFAQVLDAHNQGKVYFWDYIDGLNAQSQYQQTSKTVGTHATMSCALMLGGEAIGALVMHSEEKIKVWSENEIAVMKVVSEILTSVLLRTDREEALKEVNESNRLLLDSTNDGIGMLDRDGFFININEKLANRMGKTVAEAIGMNFKVLLHKEQTDNLYDQMLQRLQNTYDTQQIEFFEDYSNGMWFYNRVYPIFKEGKVSAVALFSTDMTDRKKAEEEVLRNAVLLHEAQILREKEKEYLEILDGSTEGSWIFDCKNKYMEYSPKWLKRIGGENMRGKEANEYAISLLHPEDKERVLEDFMTCFESENLRSNMEYRIKMVDSGYIWILAQWKIMRDKTGAYDKVYGTLMDITDRKHMELKLKKSAAELAKKNKLITEFFTNISHEFKTPLAIILLQLELMSLYLDDERKMKEMINTATQNSYRLSRLIGNILDITKIEAGYSKAHYATVDIVSLLQDICESVDSYARNKSIALSFATSLTVKEMPIDIEKTERILLNLLSNAIKNTDRNGRIEVSATENGNGGVIISVKDTGVGIPKDKLETIFDRFAQVDTSLNRLNEGCGIGLALVKSKIDILGGKISVQSELGKGSQFIIELPLFDISSQPSSAVAIGYKFAKKVELELSDL